VDVKKSVDKWRRFAFNIRMKKTRDRLARWALVALILGNVADTIFTTIFLELRVAEEANPILALIYRASPALFAFVKGAATSVCGFFLYKHRAERWAMLELAACAIFYAALDSFYLYLFCRHLFLAR
jgi:hypothetical protein